MDFLPIAVLILFVFLGGFIAVVADELGRRIGKRRLSFRKFRPKTTAKILTFAWGMLVTLFTMILIGLSSSDMRMLLTRGRSAIQDLEHQRQVLLDDQAKLRKEVKQMTARVYEEQGKAAAAERKRDAAETKATSAESRATAAKTRIADIDRQMASVQASYSQARNQLATAKTQFKQVNVKLGGLKTALAKLQQSHDYVYKEYISLTGKNQDLTIQNRDLEKKIEETAKEIAAKNESIKILNEQKIKLQQDITNAQDALTDAQADLLRVQQLAALNGNAAATGARFARFHGVLFFVGEELARVPIPAGTSKDQASGKIEEGLAKAREAARNRGAKPWNNIEYAGLVALPDDQGNTVSIEAQKNVIASEVAGSSDDQVLIVYAQMNAFTDESVVVAFSHRPNPVIYQQNQVLAEVRVDGRQDNSKILSSLDGLGTRVRARALQDKMIPVQNGNMGLGSVSPEDIISLFTQIRTAPGSVRVQAIVKRQTRAADPLVLDFKVK